MEARVGIAYTEGVVKRCMTLEQIANVTSTSAARIMVLYPRKRAITPWSDAEYTTDSPEEADELLEMAHARRPWARVTIYDDKGRVRRS